MTTHAEAVQRQFDPQAAVYLASAVHAAGPDLAQAEQWLATLGADRAALDVGTGAGHLAFAMARHLGDVVASDPSPGMLDTVAAAARERGLARLTTRLCGAERLPFGDAAFDVVGTRYSAHHWLDLDAALAEMRRVVRPDGALLVIDLLGEDDPLIDTHLQAMEVLRDPSHVRNRSEAQWRAAIAAAGFDVNLVTRHAVRLEFDSWIARMRTPSDTAAAIRRLQQGAPSQVKVGLSIEPDGSFTVSTGVMLAMPR